MKTRNKIYDKSRLRLLCLLTALFGIFGAGQIWAQTKPAGAGTQENPYQIGTAEELFWFAGLVNGTLEGVEKDTDAWAELTADITIPEGQTWTPIGVYITSSSSSYTGTFDGQGHTIDGLVVNNPNTPCQGFVGRMDEGGVLQNLTLDVGCSVTGEYSVGGFCGQNNGTIQNCANRGKVSGSSGYVGGLCGCNYGDPLTGCTNAGTVTSSGNYVGGLCGDSNSAIQNCTNSGAVTGGNSVGGLCGYTSSLTNCTNTGAVSGNSSVGGLCGSCGVVTLANCANSGTVLGNSDVGGLCGSCGGGNLANCYNTGKVTGSSNVGSLCGNSYVNSITGKASVITDCYWLEGTCEIGIGYDNNYGEGIVTNVDVKSADQFKSGEVCRLLNGSSSDSPVWYQNLDNGQTVDEYPVPDSSHGTVYHATYCQGEEVYSNSPVSSGHKYNDNGVCTLCGGYQPAELNETGVYQISNAGQLFWFAALVNGTLTDGTAQNTAAWATLTDDIDLSGEAWTPIGNYSASTSLKYTGTFDGAGHTISNLTTVDNSSSNYQGFVGYLGTNGVIKNLTLDESCSVAGYYYVGGICGYNSGTTENCANTYTVTGEQYVGGVCGYNEEGTITNCANGGAVTSTYQYVGGVCGRMMSGSIESCYNTGSVSVNYRYVGGVCGENNNGTIESCYNTGAVNGDFYAGGVCGANSGTIKSCYWLNTAYSGNGIGISFGSETNVASKTVDQFASGEVCWLLNGSASENVSWYQNLNNGQTVDKYPVLDSSHGTVYHAIDCKSEEIYSNSPINDGHQYDADGVCTVCDGYQLAELNGDVYEISNAGQLFWFAGLVNGDHTHAEFDSQNVAASAVLTDNITIPDGKNWTPIGNASTIYTGTFDGAGFTISGMTLENAESYSGLFGNVTGTVRDFTVTGTITITGSEAVSKVGGAVGSLGIATAGGTVSGVTSDVDITVSAGNDHIGGVVGSMPENSSPTVENCVYTGDINITVAAGSVAGVVGYIRTGTIQNCANQGGISVSGSGDGSVGGILGYCNNKSIKITACYNTGIISASGTAIVGAIVGNNRDDNNHVGQATVSNCYYLTGSADKGQGQLDTDAVGTVVKDDNAFTSGEVACLLQGDQTVQVWGQTLGTDNYPVLSTNEAKRVYAAKLYNGSADDVTDFYANTPNFSSPEKPNALLVIEDAVSASAGANIVVKSGDAYTCANLVLTDGADFYTPVTFTAGKATYSRTLPETSTWGTIVLPFEATTTDVSLYEATEIIADGSEESILAVQPLTGGALEANTPALFQGEMTGITVTFSATGVEVAATENAVLTKTIGESGYILTGSLSTIDALSEGDLFIARDKFWSVGTTNKVRMQAFRAYIDAPEAGPAQVNALRILIGDATSIRQALSDGTLPVDVYSLQGVQLRQNVERSEALEGLPAGIYIVGGKKVVKK